MIRYTYKKEERLKSKKIIAQLFTEGKHFFKYPIKLVYLPIPSDKYPVYFTCTVSKRNIKTAVSRNLIKRRIKESYRKNKELLWSSMQDQSHSLAIMAIYVANKELPYQQIENSLTLLLKKLSK